MLPPNGFWGASLVLDESSLAGDMEVCMSTKFLAWISCLWQEAWGQLRLFTWQVERTLISCPHITLRIVAADQLRFSRLNSKVHCLRIEILPIIYITVAAAALFIPFACSSTYIFLLFSVAFLLLFVLAASSFAICFCLSGADSFKQICWSSSWALSPKLLMKPWWYNICQTGSEKVTLPTHLWSTRLSIW